ncbi:DUF2298 domain-containing protein [Kiritimatiellaeota bacterium B1221]|nr:DUF2298 domain-containing protein [Kiritimatiellaeota bacterium B1221]
MSKIPVQPLFHLAMICLLAFGLRHAGWNWDEGQHLHPDERHLSMVTQKLDHSGEWFNTQSSGFNPYNQGVHSYVYGLLPLKVVHAFTVARGESDLKEIARTGRLCSAWWSTATVALIFLFGWRIRSARFAAIASLLMCLTVFSIQQAHFFTVDSAGVFFTTLCCGWGLLALKESRALLLLPAGAAVGLAMACRLNLGLLAFWLGALSLALAWKQKRITPVLTLIGGGILAALLFRICQPNAFLSTGFFPAGMNPRWLQDLQSVRAISEGTLEVPFTLQWVGRIPWLYALSQIILWGMGLPLGIITMAGALWILWTHRHQPARWQVFLVLWPLLLIAYHGGVFLHTMRYFLPAYPALILGGTWLLCKIKHPQYRRSLTAIILGATTIYALAFVGMYKQPHPRIQASEWLLTDLAAGGSVVSEHWDDALPLYLPGGEQAHAGIRFAQLEVYHPESPEKLHTLLTQIEQADYLILSSTRASYTLPRMPLRYPVMTRFYQHLGETELGLKEVKRFYRSPRIFSWQFNTLNAEEAFRVYDHPLVRIYEKTEDFHLEKVEKFLSEGINFTDIPPIPYLKANRSNQGWLNPDEIQKRQQNESWNHHFSPQSFGNRAPLLVWFWVLFLLGPLSFPFTFFLFPSLQDRGASVSRLLGLLAVSTLAWWPAAIGWIPFGRALLIVSMLFGSGSALLVATCYETFRDWLKRHWKTLLWGEGLQWSFFALFLILRILQPDLWHPWAGGEKPMDFAYLNATVQTPYFPPPNPWLSGAFLNYYYYGFVLFATLIRLTGISPDLAYNLALPTCALFIAGGAVALSMIFYPAFRTRSGWKGWRTSSLLTASLILLAGNLGQLREFLKPGKLPFVRDVYWNASRVIQVPPGVAQPITEFPLFSLLYGDLHAHLMALPVSMLCLLSSWQLFRRFHPARLIVCGGILGALQVINAWDLPIQFAIFLYCLMAGAFPLQNPRSQLWSRLGWAFCAWVTFKLSFAPFHWHYAAYPAKINLWEGPRSGFLDLFLAHGLFLLPLFAGLALLFRRKALRTAPIRSRLLPLLLLAGCLTTITLVEFFCLDGDAGRMNMVFKFYFQVWWILALLTAPIIVAAWKIPHPLYKAACGVLLALSLLYTLTAIPAKQQDRYWQTAYHGLDGLAYMQDAQWFVDGQEITFADDRRAIEWLRSHAKPFDVIMEAHRPLYQWGGRISWHTGLPAVLGWDWHMQQQRSWTGGEQAVYQRRTDIGDFYRSGDISILKKYHVKYLVAGQLEKVTYGSHNLQKLHTLPQLKEVFTGKHTSIFEVK